MKKHIILYSIIILLFFSCSNSNNKENQYEKEYALAKERLEKETEARRKADNYYVNKPGGSNFAYDVAEKDLNNKTFGSKSIMGLRDPETGSSLTLKFQFKYRNNSLRGTMIKSIPIPNTEISSEEKVGFTANIKDKHIIVNLSNNEGSFIFTYFPDRNEPDSNTLNIDKVECIILRNYKYDKIQVREEDIIFYTF